MNTRDIRFKSNRIRDIKSLYHSELDPLYGHAEVAVFVEMLFEAFLGWDRVKLLVDSEKTINQSDLLRFHWALEDLRRHRPIQYIIGRTEFCGCRIEVNPSVLIPRPETEEIVQWIISQSANPHPPSSILDLCTGSGCIAIALKKAFPQAEVTAVDISPEALAVAQRNAEANGLEISFVESDILSDDSDFPYPMFNLITANPPYVRDSERIGMSPNVLEHEPHGALFVPDADPLLFYRAICCIADRSLADSGLLVLEINEALASDTTDLLCRHGFRLTLHHDFRGRPRFLSATRF